MLHILWAYKCIKHAYISVFCWSFYSVHILTLTKHLSGKLYELSKHFTHIYNRLRLVFNNTRKLISESCVSIIHHDTRSLPQRYDHTNAQQHPGNNKISIT